MNAAIKVENLSKRYQIAKQLKKDLNFQEQLTDLLVGPFRRLKKAIKGEHLSGTENFWALKDVSLVNPVKRNKLNALIKMLQSRRQGYLLNYGRPQLPRQAAIPLLEILMELNQLLYQIIKAAINVHVEARKRVKLMSRLAITSPTPLY